jgi:hypothetical protein
MARKRNFVARKRKSETLTLRFYFTFSYYLKKETSYLADSVMLGETIVVENRKHQSLVKGVCIGKVFELKKRENNN